MTTHRVYIGLGTNVGDRWGNLARALAHLQELLTLDQVSPVYETEPWGYTDQPPFLNAVASGRTDLAPRALLTSLKALERTLGREPTFRYGPRVIDLDILFYGERVLLAEELIIPHPRLHERAFVLVPLADLAPDLVHPVLGRRVRDLLAGVDTGGVQRVPGRLAGT